MKKLLLSMMSTAVMFTVSAAPAVNYFRRPKAKLLQSGWMFQRELNHTEYIKKNIAELEKNIPGQGMIFQIDVPPERCGKRNIRTNNIFGSPRVEYDDYNADVENLKSTRFIKFTDNFISSGVSPGNVDWFSDSAWADVCHNFKVLARVAKNSGMKGIKIDIEEYRKNRMWQFQPEKGKSLEETCRMIRQRGREFGKAIFSEFPDIHLLCYWWCSLAKVKNNPLQPERARYLVAPFVNGIYDVLPPTATIHEGNETHGYRSNNESEAYFQRVDLALDLMSFIDVDNVAKYRAQTRLAPALYIDPHFTERKNYWHNQLEPDLSRLGRAQMFKRNLQYALEIADEYIWTWMERFSWMPSSHPAKTVVLDTIAPGLVREMDIILRPEEYVAELKKQNVKMKNLLPNGSFDKVGKGRKIPGFTQWVNGKNGKVFQISKINGSNAAVLKDGKNGVLQAMIPAKPGEMYLVEADCYVKGVQKAGTAFLTVNWRDAKENRHATHQRRRYDFCVDKDGSWEHGSVIVTAPDGAVKLEVLVTVNSGNTGNMIGIDTITVYRILK